MKRPFCLAQQTKLFVGVFRGLGVRREGCCLLQVSDSIGGVGQFGISHAQVIVDGRIVGRLF